MKDYVSRFAYPGQDPSKPVRDGAINEVFGPLGVSAGHITTDIDDDGLTATNKTMPDHIFYDGQVVRHAVQAKDGSWFMVTTGTGNNVTPGMATINNLVGPGTFDAVDQKMRQYIETNQPLR